MLKGLNNYFKIISIKIDNIPEFINPLEAEKAELRPKFLVPFSKRFNLDTIPDIIGRHEEIHAILDILGSSVETKGAGANVMLLGFPGTGKTTIIQQIAKWFAEGKLDSGMIDSETTGPMDILYLPTKKLKESVEKSAKKVGELEEYIKKFPSIIFTDEAHHLGRVEITDSSPIAEDMKDFLPEIYSHFVFSTTVEEHDMFLAPIVAFCSRCVTVPVPEPDQATTYIMMTEYRQNLLQQKKFKHLPATISIPDAMVNLAVELAIRYIDPRKYGYNPRRSVRLLGQAISCLINKHKKLERSFYMTYTNIFKIFNEYIRALAQKEKTSVDNLRKLIKEYIEEYLKNMKTLAEKGILELTEEDLYKALSMITNSPRESFKMLDIKFLDKLPDKLKEEVVGQDNVMDEIATRIKRSKLGLGDSKKPIFAGILAGPTGVGKTQTAKALAKLLFGNEDAIVTVNGPDYDDKFKSTNLIGSPKAFVGYGEKSDLDEVTKKFNGRCVVLIDEFEKMYIDAQDIFLRILDEGKIKNSKQEVIDFKDAIIIFTSNLGSEKLKFVKIESTAENFDELLAFRRETVDQVEKLAEEFESQSQKLQAEALFKEAVPLTTKAAEIRKILIQNRDNLQKGIFLEEPTGIKELDEFLSSRKAEDKELKEIFEKGGGLKYERLLRKHRQKALEELKEWQRKIGDKLDEFMGLQKVENGQYLTAILTGDEDLETVHNWAAEMEAKDQQLVESLNEAVKAEKGKSKIEEENQRVIEKVFSDQYKPEFLGRVRALGGIFAYNGISRQMAQQIIRLHTSKFIDEQKRLYRSDIEIAPEVYDYLLVQIKDLKPEGGRGIEKLVGRLIKDKIGEEFIRTGKRSNTRVTVVLQDGNLKVNIIPLGEPDVTVLPPQEGESGQLLEHFHQQALDLNGVYSGYSVSIDEIKTLLEGRRIVDRGTPLQFEPTEELRASGILESLADFRKTSFNRATKFLAQHLLDEDALKPYVLAIQEIAKGLTLLSAKTLFNYILKTDFKNSHDNFDTLTEKGQIGGNGVIKQQIDNVIMSGAAKEAVVNWDLTPDGVNFQISVPCKLTEKELKLLKIYNELAVDDPSAAQKLYEEAKNQGLHLDQSLLRNIAIAKKIAGAQVGISFYISEGMVTYSLRAPIVKAKPQLKEEKKADEAKKSPVLLDNKKLNDMHYLGTYLKSKSPEWDRLGEESLSKDQDCIKIINGLVEYFKEFMDMAENKEGVREIIEDIYKNMLTKDHPELEKSPSFAYLFWQSLNRVLGEEQKDISIYRKISRQVEANRNNQKLFEIAAKIKPAKTGAQSVLDLFNNLINLNAVTFEGIGEAEFKSLLSDSNLLQLAANNIYFCRLLSEKKAELIVGPLFVVKIGAFKSSFKFPVRSVNLSEEINALEEKIDAFIKSADKLPEEFTLTARHLAEASDIINAANTSPFASRFIEKILNSPAVPEGSFSSFKQGILNSLSADQNKITPSSDGKGLDFGATAGIIKSLLLKLDLNSKTGNEAEKPYSEEEIKQEQDNILKNGNSYLARALIKHLKLNEKAQKKPKVNPSELINSLLSLNYSSLTGPEQADFWAQALADLLDNLEPASLKAVLKKALNDKYFAKNIFPVILPILKNCKKAYALNFDQAREGLAAALNFAKEFKLEDELKQELSNWFYAELNNLINLIEAENPNQAQVVNQIMTDLSNTWIARENGGAFMAAMQTLIARLNKEIAEISAKIVEVAPSLEPFTKGKNQLAIYQAAKEGTNPIPGAVNTVDLLKKDKKIFDSVNKLLESELGGKDKPFKVLRQGSSFTVNSLKQLLVDNRNFFDRNGGSVMVLAVTERNNKKYLYVSVTARSAGNTWAFEAEIL